MPRYASKEELVKAIRSGRSRLEKTLAGLTAEEKESAGVVGEWSVKDLLAHLFDWEQRFIGWYHAGKRGETPETPAPGMTWGQLDELNHQIYERYRAMPLDEVQSRFDASSAKILALIEGMTEDELLRPGAYAWNGREALAGWAAANTCSHYEWARGKVRAWQKAKGPA